MKQVFLGSARSLACWSDSPLVMCAVNIHSHLLPTVVLLAFAIPVSLPETRCVFSCSPLPPSAIVYTVALADSEPGAPGHTHVAGIHVGRRLMLDQ